MEKEAINKAIAESLGRKYHKPTEAEIASGSYHQYEPDFTSDLNAMHEAENNLAVNKAPEYSRQLALACERDYSASNRLGMGYNLWHATAAQRAEAFLKTLGLWETK